MLFNSLEFIFLFLPIVFLVYFCLTKLRLILVSKLWLVGSSLFFYSWWNIVYLPLILISLLFNYTIGTTFHKLQSIAKRRVVLVTGIIFNVGLLGYFKYTDFFLDNLNYLFDTDIPLLNLALPLAISFFTFQQIAFLVDAYRNETKEYDFLNYALFITFFPQLIAGPIVHHQEMMPQFERARNKVVNVKNITIGLFIFSIGLCKKVVIADSFAVWATEGFDHTETLSFIEGWITSLSYTFQLYFDFSGYTDMAIGAALLFNIVLPVNFNSPYKAVNIQDFWSRWHITLSRFLSKYIYIPLGGNRKGTARTYINVFLVFMISGLWHGAGWTFVFWGFLHGIASVIHRYWKTFGIKMPTFLAWFITFQFVNIAWVFFRATTWGDAMKVLKGMFGLNGFTLPPYFQGKFIFIQNLGFEYSAFYLENSTLLVAGVALILGLLVTTMSRNSIEISTRVRPTFSYGITFILLTSFNIIYIIYMTGKSEFLYFNF